MWAEVKVSLQEMTAKDYLTAIEQSEEDLRMEWQAGKQKSKIHHPLPDCSLSGKLNYELSVDSKFNDGQMSLALLAFLLNCSSSSSVRMYK
jgi:hypothetical protein